MSNQETVINDILTLPPGSSLEIEGEIVASGLNPDEALDKCFEEAKILHDQISDQLRKEENSPHASDFPWVNLFHDGQVKPAFAHQGHTWNPKTGECRCGLIDSWLANFKPKYNKE